MVRDFTMYREERLIHRFAAARGLPGLAGQLSHADPSPLTMGG